MASTQGHLIPVVILIGVTLLVWLPPVAGDFGHLRLSNPGDSESFAYYLSWNVHAIFTGQDPFFTPNLYAPDGLDLGNAISLPYVSLLVSPIAAAFGGTAAYNVAFLLAVSLAAISIYLLARLLFGSIVGAVLAGSLMVVSPYLVGHALGHLNLLWIFGLPLLAYVALRFVRGELRGVWLLVWCALIVAFTAGASTELLVTQSLFAVLALVVALVFARPWLRSRLVRSLPWLAGGFAAGVVLAIPVILAALRSGLPELAGNPPDAYPADLTNFFAPTPVTLIGSEPFSGLWPLWRGNAAENTAFIPASLWILLAAYAFAVRSRLSAAIAAFAGLSAVASFGPYLTIAGQQTVMMPWRLAVEIPGVDHALPVRFSAFVFMAVLLLVAHAWARRVVPRAVTAVAVAVSAALLFPNFGVLQFPTPAPISEYVSSGRLGEDVEPGDNVLVLPAGQWGPGMRWQDETDFVFSMPTGNGGGAVRPDAFDDPVGLALWERDLGFDFDRTLVPYLERMGVDVVMVDEGHPEWLEIVRSALGREGTEEDGVWVFDQW